MAATMLCVESIKVPSQSNTTSEYDDISDRLQLFQYFQTGRRQLGRQRQGLARNGMGQGQAVGMQEHPAETQAREVRPHLIMPVLVVSHDGKAAGGQVHPDLVGTPGAQLASTRL